ncbi:kelch repeat and BTB domain-containing protein 3-like [Amphiura filiformis]|uniref:kelch repeat and BTB domain-containing protein 3-like n=1 Tax=Amphiura filiformis TaxID=82378 RepID=UPI003B21751B
MFTSGFKEKSANEITMCGSAEAFGILLEFAYTGELNGTKATRQMFNVLDLACYIQFTEFAETSSEFLLAKFESEPHKVSVRDAWNISLLARNHDYLRDLLAASLKYLDDNVKSLKNLDIFLQDASVTFLQDFLCREDLSNEDEEKQVLELVSNWLKHDWSNRCSYSHQLLQKVRLGLVTSDDIKDILGPEILGIQECCDFVNHVLQLHASDTSKDTLAFENPDLFMGRSAITAPIASREHNSFEFYNQKLGFGWKWKRWTHFLEGTKVFLSLE